MTTKYTKWTQNIPNDHKIYQMTTNYTKWPQNIHTNIFHSTAIQIIPNDHKMYANWYFWFVNIWQPWFRADFSADKKAKNCLLLVPFILSALSREPLSLLQRFWFIWLWLNNSPNPSLSLFSQNKQTLRERERETACVK
jgi:hypothetical protein